MASPRWKGAAQAVAQVNTVTVGGTPANGQVYTVTMGLNNSKSVSYTATGVDTNTTIAAALQALLAASTIPEFQEVTWTVGTTVITGTAVTAGKPFTNTSSATGTGTLVTATTTANTGPNNWDNAANWSTNAVPVNADNVYVENSSTSIKYGLAQSGVTLASLNVASSFTGDIGLPEVNADGTAYLEYRAQYLAIGATAVNVGYGPGQGSGRIKLDNGAVQTTLNVANTAQGAEQNLEALQWKGTHVSNVVNVTKGTVALAGYGGDAATVATLNVGYVTSQSSDATVRGGAGLTLTTLNMSGGSVDLSAGGLTTVAKVGGTLTLRAGNVTTLTDDSGTTAYLGTGTVTTWNVGAGAVADFSQDMRGRTVTTMNVYKGATVSDPFATLTVSNPVHLVRCRLTEVTLDFGENKNYAVT